MVGAVDVGESDRIVRFLTPDEGRVSLMVRKARSNSKRWGGLLELGTALHVQARKGRGALSSLTHAELVTAPHRARADFGQLALLAYGVEVCSVLAPEHHEAPKLFRLLQTWLMLLEGEANAGMAARVALDAKALTFAGLTPSLLLCARCGKPLEGRSAFDPEAGGGLHPHCGGGRTVPSQVLAAFEALRRTPLSETSSVPDPPAQFAGLLTDFVQHQISKPIRSRSMVEDWFGNG